MMGWEVGWLSEGDGGDMLSFLTVWCGITLPLSREHPLSAVDVFYKDGVEAPRRLSKCGEGLGSSHLCRCSMKEGEGLKTGSSIHIWSSAMEMDFNSIGNRTFEGFARECEYRQCFQVCKAILVNLSFQGCMVQQALQHLLIVKIS